MITLKTFLKEIKSLKRTVHIWAVLIAFFLAVNIGGIMAILERLPK